MTNDNSPAPAQPWQLPDVLRRPRALALGSLAATVPAATVVAFVLSYRGLVDFGLSVGVPGWLAWAYPLMFDLPVIAGEAVLFVAAVDRKTSRRVTGWAWVVTIGFAVLSSAGNAGLLPPVAARALPPLVLAILLGFGLGELRRHTAPRPVKRQPAETPKTRPSSTKPSTGGGKRSGHLDEVAERRAIDAARVLLDAGTWPGQRKFADDHCAGNRHLARRAAAAAAGDPGVVP